MKKLPTCGESSMHHNAKTLQNILLYFFVSILKYSESKQGKCTGPSISTQLIAFSS